MAEAITKRTLIGNDINIKTNIMTIDNMIEKLKKKPDDVISKISNKMEWNISEGGKMKFDAIVGNPPYQETLSNGDSSRSLARQLFPDFIKNSILLNPLYCTLITPSRWFAGDAQDGSFISLRDFIKKHNHIVKLVNDNSSNGVFDNVVIKGGVSYFLYDPTYNGKVQFTNIINDKKVTQSRDLFEDGLDVILSSSEVYGIIQKVKNDNFVSMTSITKGRNAFGIVGRQDIIESISSAEKFEGAVKLQCKGGEIRWTSQNNITKSQDVFKAHKVFISKSAGDPAKDNKIIGKPYYAEPYSACSDSLIPIGCFKTKAEAINCQSYLKTLFARFMISILKVSQNVYQNVYQFVPLQDFTNNSDIDWSKSIPEIDQQLYKKYNLTEDEITFIEKTIKPME
jgi:hypothetical protein